MKEAEEQTSPNQPNLKPPDSTSDGTSTDNQYLKLRRLLLGDDYSSALNRYISKEEEAERVAEVLPDAVKQSAKEGSILGEALAPVVDKAIEKSIRENPNHITNVIFPIMGPAIRKAVSSALSEMVQSLNTLLEQSLTFKSLNWRIKAWRSGMPYAQYVLLQTVKYRVEQVLLVHRETGLLLHSVTASEIQAQDPELVSSMLTAISDFVSDSFSSEEDTLERIRFGHLELHVMVGPQAILAIAVRGAASDELALKANTTVETVHAQFSDQLSVFEGDRMPFENTHPILSECLLSQKIDQKPKQKPWLAIILIMIGMASLITLQVKSYQYDRLLEEVEQALRQEPGYIVLSFEQQEKGVEVEILRSPDSRSVENVRSALAKNKVPLTIKDTMVHFGPLPATLTEPSLRPLINVETVTKELLVEGEQVVIISQNGRLSISGQVSEASLQRLQNSEQLKASYEDINLSSLTILPELTAHDQLQSLINTIQQTILYFEPGSTHLNETELVKIPSIINNIKKLEQLSSEQSAMELQLLIMGFADDSGTTIGNKAVSQERAETIRTLLTENAISANIIVAWGLGNIDHSNISKNTQRRVTLQVLPEATITKSSIRKKVDSGDLH
jgi:OOP family OmpA-OmpF porin